MTSTFSSSVNLAAWRIAIRPKTLPASVAPIAVGTAIAWREDGFSLITALAALAVALLLQIGSNLANDLFDFQKGADDQHRIGPLRVTQGGLISPVKVLRGTVIVLALAIVLGLYLVWQGGWPIFIAGLLAVVAAVAYTGGPAPLGYLGLGELFVFLFFGLVGVAGTVYVQTHELTALSILAAVPIGCLITGILVVNNLRDIATDRSAGKRTLAVRFGDRWARREYGAILIVAYVMPLALGLVGLIGKPWCWFPLVTAPMAWTLWQTVRTESGRALNLVLADTARLSLFFALAFAASIVAP